MIKLSKTISSDNPGVIQLKQNSVPQLGNVNERLPDNINLNNMPYYPLPSKKDKINADATVGASVALEVFPMPLLIFLSFPGKTRCIHPESE